MGTATVMEAEIVERLAAVRVIPVTSVDDGDQAGATAQALMRAGLSCIEVTFRTAAAAEAIRRARSVDGLLVGAGTVLTTEQVREAADAGAHFALAPGLNEEVVSACQDIGMPFFPGVATASEIERARALGLRTLKVFPASTVGGPAFLRAVSATYRDVRFIPTGGIGPDNLVDYLAVASVLAVGGSWLVKESLLRAGRFGEVERLAREAVGGGS
jgi:2-dehydro-3-deoxyphosphogluconate aldolase/(4S)-4-hydroxy-2-oxoglutarate aldolase